MDKLDFGFVMFLFLIMLILFSKTFYFSNEMYL